MACVVLFPIANLQVSKIDSADPVGAGNPYSYFVTITNTGDIPITNIQLTDTLSLSGLGSITIIGTVPPAGGACEPPILGNQVTCTFPGPLNPGVTIIFEINVIAELELSGPQTATNIATVTSLQVQGPIFASETTTIITPL